MTEPILCYLTGVHPCGYLEHRIARSEVVSPRLRPDPRTFSHLVRNGFRRSGNYVYRPACDDCQECIPIRLRVAEFRPDRSQKRAWKRHLELVAREMPLEFVPEHFELYRRYQAMRHPGGGMDKDEREDYVNSLLQSTVDTRLVEFRAGDTLCMVSIIDVLDDGLSSVYTFFDPEVEGASFGTYGILWQIECCKALGRPYLYLGYLVEASRKMSYKRQFKPCEHLIAGHWV